MRTVRCIIFNKKKLPNLLRPLDKKIATSGWGLYPLVAASVQRTRYLSDLGRVAETPVLPQGNCRSYGDAWPVRARRLHPAAQAPARL